MVCRQTGKHQNHKESNGLQTTMKKLETQRIQSFVDNHAKTRQTKNPMVCRKTGEHQKNKESNGLKTAMKRPETQRIQGFVDNYEKKTETQRI